jgi:hypothetical protein
MRKPYIFGWMMCALLLLPAGLAAGAQIQEPSTDPASPLKGRVRGAALLTKDGLIRIGTAATDVQKSCLLVIAEVTRKETLTVKPPNVLPNSVVIPALPDPSGTIRIGDLPARKKYLDQFMNETSYQVQLLQNSVDALIIPDDKTAAVSGPWGKIAVTMADVQKHHAQLKVLTEGPKYDKEQIAREALAIHDDMSTVKKLRDEVLKTIQGRG